MLGMLAVLYLILAVYFGDLVCRRFLVYTSVAHRAAAAFLTGILFSSCISYLFAWAFARSEQPLFWSSIGFAAVVIIAAFVLELRFPVRRGSIDKEYRRPPGSWPYDAACLAVAAVAGYSLMVSTLNYADGAFLFAGRSWSDFGANISLTQSFLYGDNFPTVHPFYPHEPIRYHFLFWFLSANLGYLGMNVVWAVNLLSVLSLVAMLTLLMIFAEMLFNSRVVARLSVLLFFLATSSLSYIPFLWARIGSGEILKSVWNLNGYVPSGFPYRGDDWGALSVIVYANQRQLISAVGIVLLVLIYLIGFYRRKNVLAVPDYEKSRSSFVSFDAKQYPSDALAFIFCGVLIGMLPYWNSALFLAASLIMGALFILFPYRHYMFLMLAAIGACGLPQLLLLRSGRVAADSNYLFNWGYIVQDPTPGKVFDYVLWTFGLKLLLFWLAYRLVPKMYRRLFLALCAPVVVAFLFQLSTDMFNNHKLINIGLTLTSVYAAFAIWAIGRKGWANAILAGVLLVVMTLGSAIDLFPIKNDGRIKTQFENDQLTEWILANTKPDDLFLTDLLLSHPILMSGRKIFMGNTLYAWTAGYNLGLKEQTYRMLYNLRTPQELLMNLEANGIDYVAIDDGIRNGQFTKTVDEALFRSTLELVYEDNENKYGNLRIYKVPYEKAND